MILDTYVKLQASNRDISFYPGVVDWRQNPAIFFDGVCSFRDSTTWLTG